LSLKKRPCNTKNELRPCTNRNLKMRNAKC
jgi:hypothetical protein